MKLETFISQQFVGDAVRGALGVESDWLDVGLVSLPTGTLHITGYVGDQSEGFIAPLGAGVFEAKAKTIRYGHEIRMSRVCLVGPNRAPIRGEKIGEAGTDSGTMVLYDLRSYGEAETHNPKFRDTVLRALLKIGLYFELVPVEGWPAHALLAGSSGFDDGTFPIFELRDGPNVAGVEIVFIKPDQPYPFKTNKYETPPEADEDETLH